MRTSLIAFFIATLLISSHAQDADDQPQVDELQGGAQFQGQDGFQGQDPQMDEAFIENQRTKLWSCFFLTKHKLYALNPELQGAFAEAKDVAPKVYNKIIGLLFTGCVLQVQVEEGQQILATLQEKEFDLSTWDHLFNNFDVERFKDPQNVDSTLDPNESMFVEYFNKMDEQIREKYGSQDGEGGQRDSGYENLFGRRMDTEPKIGGLSFANMSSTTKLVYLAIIGAIIAAVFYYAYTQLFAEKESAYEKAKKARKEKEKKRDKSK